MTRLWDFLRRAKAPRDPVEPLRITVLPHDITTTDEKGDDTMPDPTTAHPPLHLSGRLLLEGGPLSHGRIREATATWRDELQAYAVTLPSAEGPACYRYDGEAGTTARLSFVGLAPASPTLPVPEESAPPPEMAPSDAADDAPDGGDE